MPATPYELHVIASNQDFQRRVKCCMQKAASDVLAEDQNTLGHVHRATYAGEVLSGEASPFEHGLASLQNPTLTASADINQPHQGGFGITDNDLEFAVNEQWNAMSGVSTGPAVVVTGGGRS